MAHENKPLPTAKYKSFFTFLYKYINIVHPKAIKAFELFILFSKFKSLESFLFFTPSFDGALHDTSRCQEVKSNGALQDLYLEKRSVVLHFYCNILSSL